MIGENAIEITLARGNQAILEGIELIDVEVGVSDRNVPTPQ